MFDLDQFVADCVAARAESEPRQAVKEVLARAVSEPHSVEERLPARRAEIERLHVSDVLTIIKVVWAPGMDIRPHDHRMWAAIGIYGGQEDNSFFRRTPGGVVQSGAKQLAERDVALLGDDTIHAVANPRRSFTGAIHIYGGDFFNQARSEFDPVTLEESPYDMVRTLAEFEAANDNLPTV
jgi:predicted metal-dependent enzyme (double-stranded beta helix superfamily)